MSESLFEIAQPGFKQWYRRRTQHPLGSYAIVRDSEAEAKRELEWITTVGELPAGYANFDQWLSGTQLEREMKLQEYAVSNRGLRPNLVGTPEQLKQRIADYKGAGLDLLLQMSPQAEEMERFAAQVMGTHAPAPESAAAASDAA